MNILVTGGAGYIGSSLVPSLLNDGHFVTVVDDLRLGGHGLRGVWGHQGFYLEKMNLFDCCSCDLEDQDVVIHLAALVGEPPCTKWPEEARKVNVEGVRHMAEVARKAGVKHFLFSSTCSNYGKQPGGYLDEESPLEPLSLYAETKIEAERIVSEMNSPGFATTIFRFATAYGVSPRMRFDTMLNEFTRDAVVDRWLLIYGKESYRTLVHVQDIIQMVKLCMIKREEAAGEVFNVGDHHISKQMLAELFQEHVPDLEVEYKDQKRDPRDYKASFQKALDFGYDPQYCVVDGILEVASAIESGLFPDPHSHLWRNVQ